LKLKFVTVHCYNIYFVVTGALVVGFGVVVGLAVVVHLGSFLFAGDAHENGVVATTGGK
jgi:hypothetical protein